MSSAASSLYVSEGPDLVHYSVNVQEATLSRRGVVKLPANVQYAWPHPTHRFLYAATSTSGPGLVAGNEHHLSAVRIGRDGTLSPHGAPVPLPVRPLHTSVDASGQYVLAAYNRRPDGSARSWMTVHRINADGRIGEEVPQDPDLDGGIYAHQIRVLPSNRSVVVVARGNDPKADRPEDPGALKLYTFQNGVLHNADTVAPNGGYAFGPRHLDFHPTKPWAYVSLERENKLEVFAVHNDLLSHEPLFTKPSVADPKNVQPRQLAGAIHVHPNGRYVYIANRANGTIVHEGKKVFAGGYNSIAVFEIDATTGEHRVIQHADPLGYVRCFGLDPSGQILVTANMITLDVLEGNVIRHVPRALTVFRIESDGKLTLARRYDVDTGGKYQVWMAIVGLPE